MSKYFFESEQLRNGKITLQGDTAHHLLHVLRIAVGDEIILCNGANVDYYTVVTELPKSKLPTVKLEMRAAARSRTESHTEVTLYQSLPKGDKLDTIIQKCVELGVFEIVPVETERSVVRIKDAQKKSSRYQRIAESAAGQSMRGIIPTVRTAVSFAEAVAELDTNALTLVAHEQEKTRILKEAIMPRRRPETINLWIGPEGGFTPEEIAALQEAQAVTVSLGTRTLRTETAAIAMLAQVMYEVEG